MLKIRQDEYVNMDNVRRIKIGPAVEVAETEMWPVEVHYSSGDVDTIQVSGTEVASLEERLDNPLLAAAKGFFDEQ